MASRRTNTDETSRRRRAPATTPEARENQLISLATDLAEKQLQNGEASAQVITHYLKLGTTRANLEDEKIRLENELLKARKEAIESQQRIEELYVNAIAAMRNYGGHGSEPLQLPEYDYEQ